MELLEAMGARYQDEVKATPRVPHLESGIVLRDYQEAALDAWRMAGNRGTIVLPTGAGKTVVALKALEALQVATLVVVPTLVLVDQWRGVLEEAFNVEVGVLGGGRRDVRAITVSTYDSAMLRAGSIGNRFELIVFDEAHHLPASSYQKIGREYIAPYRLGLTATLPKGEGALGVLEELVGGRVYHVGVEELAGTHLSEFSIRTIRLPLSPAEKLQYDKEYATYRDFLRRRDIRIRSSRDYIRFVQRSGRDPEARRALLARNRAMDIALNSSTKLQYLRDLLKANVGEKTLIFTRYNNLVYRISREMLIPTITHQTPREEREDVLTKFHEGSYMRLVTSQVLDEGVDVPDASMAVILSGTGSSRQFIQRLGRILRKKPGKKAVLYELVSEGTAETRMSERRRRG